MSGSGSGNGAKFTMRETAVLIGLGVSLISIFGTAVGGGIWVGRIDQRVSDLQSSSVTDGRITRLETKFDNMAEANKDLKASVERLIGRLDRANRRTDNP